jgi:hypothetical protein
MTISGGGHLETSLWAFANSFIKVFGFFKFKGLVADHRLITTNKVI